MASARRMGRTPSTRETLCCRMAGKCLQDLPMTAARARRIRRTSAVYEIDADVSGRTDLTHSGLRVCSGSNEPSGSEWFLEQPVHAEPCHGARPRTALYALWARTLDERRYER